jgi:EAL domain-containing protein (putative c-di-GMP-specific phosphodiesterase class I)
MIYKLRDIIENNNISTVFQPIFDVKDKTIFGYEALTRGPVNSEFHSPETLFSYATQYGLLSELEILCRDNAIRQFSSLKLRGMLFLNISPLVLLDKNHPRGETIKSVEKAGINCKHIVIELSEKYPFLNNEALSLALAQYRKYGFNVAIDDLGAGYSSLKLWSELRPDIVKIDRYFVEGCDQDSFKRKFLIAIFDIAISAHAKVIVEGIETESEYNLLKELGMDYAQGFYLAKPQHFPSTSYPLLSNAEYSYVNGEQSA